LKFAGESFSGGVAGIDVFRSLLLTLRRHLCGIRAARNSARSELFALDVIFRSFRLAAIRFNRFDHGMSLIAINGNARMDGTFLAAGIAQDALLYPS
jgi:hypothetical protein